MDKNIKLIYCILGSIFLILLQSSVFKKAGFAFLNGSGYGTNFYGMAINGMINILSFIGFILFIVFSIVLIIKNLDFKNK